MRIAVLAHFFPPEPCAAATRIAALANALSVAGHRVTVVTNFPSFPRGALEKRHRFKAVHHEWHDAVHIVRLLTILDRRLPAHRFLHWISSAVMLLLYVLFSAERFDAVVVSVPPITLAMPALAAAWRHRAKLIVDVRDVYPDIAVAMGQWKPEGFLTRATGAAARALYSAASLIAAVTATARNQIAARNVSASKIILVPNGCTVEAPYASHGSCDATRFVAIYAGNLGLATDVDVLVDAAALLAPDNRIAITVAGGGAETERMRSRIMNEGLQNIHLTGVVERAKAMSMIARADVALVPLRKGIAESVPTKIYDALSVGCPVVVAAEGEARDAARATGGGICVQPGDAVALAEALRSLARLDKTVLQEIGERGRRFVSTCCRRDATMVVLCDRIGAL